MAKENKKYSEFTIVKKNDEIYFPGLYNNDNVRVKSDEMGRKGIQALSASGTINKQLVEIDASVTRVIATLPDRETWLGKNIYIKNKEIGIGLIQRSGTDVIGEGSKTSIPLYWEGDYLELFAGSTRWEIKSGKSKICGSHRNSSDYTGIDLASIIEVDIDGGSSPSLGFEIGEIARESVSGFDARIYDITDNGDGTGTLWLYDCDGNLTDGRSLTGQNSGASADVNEGSGTTKNLSTIFKYNLGEYLSDGNLSHIMYISSDGTKDNDFEIVGGVQDNTIAKGLTVHQVDADNLRTPFGTSGYTIITTAGAIQNMNGLDYFFLDCVIWKYGG
jgi:hypothetical protein